MVGQLIMYWDNSTDVAARIADASMLTGDREWDALVAGVVEDIACHHCAKVPSGPWNPSVSPTIVGGSSLHPGVARHCLCGGPGIVG